MQLHIFNCTHTLSKYKLSIIKILRELPVQLTSLELDDVHGSLFDPDAGEFFAAAVEKKKNYVLVGGL